MLRTYAEEFLVEFSESHITSDIFWCNFLNGEAVERDFGVLMPASTWKSEISRHAGSLSGFALASQW